MDTSDLGKLRAQFYGQLPIVAAILLASEFSHDVQDAVEDSVVLIDALFEQISDEEI
jgi:hypothetical protein